MRLSIGQVFRIHGRSFAGLIVLIGSAANLLFAVVAFRKAWLLFPDGGADEIMLLGVLHLAIPVGLIGSWVRYGRRFNFQPNKFVAVLLVLIAVAPACLSYSEIF